MLKIRHRILGSARNCKIYVAGSTASSPGSVKEGMILAPTTVSSEIYWQKAGSNTETRLRVLEIPHHKRYGGLVPETYFGSPFGLTGLAVPPHTAFDYDTTNEMLGMHIGHELIDGMEFTVNTDGYVSTSSFTVEGRLFVDEDNDGKLLQNDSPTAGMFSPGYVKVVPASDNNKLTWIVNKKVIQS